jgi:two-component system, chemotaxis family, chemotaxis protein CheY
MKILIVDDSALARKTLTRILETEHTCITAENGFQALDLFAQEKPDLAILDLVLPGMPGFEVLTALKQLDPNAVVLIGSADIQIFTRQEAQSLGADGYLTKPYHPEEVLTAVARFVK